jgi:hypothetical protein
MSASTAPPAEQQQPSVMSMPPRRSRLLRPPSAETLFALALTAALSSLALFGRGGLELKTTTHVELVLLAVAGLLGVAAALAAGTRRWWGSVVLIVFGLYAGLCATSILWSVQPHESWLEANRMIAWLGVFGGGLALVRVAGRWWSAVLSAIVASAVIVCLWALLTKIFPESFSPDETYARLRQPYEYWNAVGLTAALGIVAAVWLGARKHGNGLVSALAFPAVGLQTTAMMLAYSRGSLLALVLALAAWFIFVPMRLRGAAVIVIGGFGGALVTVWAFAQDTLTTDNVPAPDRATSGLQLGALLLIIMALQLLAGVAVRFRADGPPIAPAGRRRIGTALLVGLLLIPVAGAGKLALSDKGLGGSVSSAWKSLTDPADTSRVANDPTRLTKVASVRAKYWQEAYKITEAHKWKGVGAGGYVVARTRYRSGTLTVRHAHGYIVQTAADLGLIGVGVVLALMAAWLVAAARTLGTGRRIKAKVLRRQMPDRLPWNDERVALAAMATVVGAFGIHSFVDWTWYVPGNVVVALLCAGWVAGRGPVDEAASAPGLLWQRLKVGVSQPLRIASAAAILAFVAVAGWSTWRPLAADEAAAKAQRIATSDPRVNAEALSEAERAARLDPLSLKPLYAEAYVHVLGGRKAEGRKVLVEAVRLQPGNPDPWIQLADYTLNQLDKPKVALRLLGPALHLDPNSRQAATVYLQGSRVATEKANAAAAKRAAAKKKRKK